MTLPRAGAAGGGRLTPRQLQVLEIIARSIAERGFPPTVRELTDGLGLSPMSRQCIAEFFERLAACGMIIRHPKIARGITLTAAAHARLAELAASRAAAPPTTPQNTEPPSA